MRTWIARSTAVAMLALAACSAPSEQPADPPPQQGTSSAARDTPEPASQQAITGTVLQDGAVNGCGGEQVAVQVRASGAIIASAFADSSLEGFDCLLRFRVPVPDQPIYELIIDGQPVGCYPASVLGDGDGGGSYEVGIISSQSLSGDPDTGEPPQLYADFDGCTSLE